MRKRTNKLLIFLFLTSLTFLSCSDNIVNDEKISLDKNLQSAPVGNFITTFENFENGTKSSYAAADVILPSGSWNMSDALIGTLANDVKNGLKSVRIQNTGTVTMNFDLFYGISSVSILHAVFAGEVAGSTVTWGLFVSTSGPGQVPVWSQLGNTVTSSMGALATATFTYDIPGPVRFQIRKLSGGSKRLNIDDVSILSLTDPVLLSGCPAVEVEPNNSLFASNIFQSLPCQVKGNLPGDDDYFAVDALNGQIISASVLYTTYVVNVRQGPTPKLFIYNQNFVEIANGWNQVDVAASTSGRYYIRLALVDPYGAEDSKVGKNTLSKISGPLPNEGDYTLSVSAYIPLPDNLALGNPTNALPDPATYSNNYYMDKAYYVISYNNSKHIPNWVAWHLGISDLGSTNWNNSYTTDADIAAAGFAVVTTNDYNSSNTGAFFDRGHMCPNADRKQTDAMNEAVFKIPTNFIPQNHNSNDGPWGGLEDYLRTLVNSGKEVYIYSGGSGQGGVDNMGVMFNTITNPNSGNSIWVPAKSWKVAVVIDNGINDIARINANYLNSSLVRVIAVELPNDNTYTNAQVNEWKNHRVSIDQIEANCSMNPQNIVFDFLKGLSPAAETYLESVVDAVP